MKNIIVCLNFEEGSDAIIKQATTFSQAFQSKIWLLHVAAPDPAFVGYQVGPQYIRDARATVLRTEHKLLQEKASQLKALGLDAEGLLIIGPTAEMILEEVKKLEIDLLIIGHQPHHLVYSMLFGSVSNAVIHHSSVPVLVVPFQA